MARALRRRVLIPTPLNDLTEKIIQAAIAVHDALGPGLLESVYRRCLVVALLELGLFVEVEKALPITFRGVSIECGYRLDIVVEGKIVIEVKAVEQLAPVHVAQMMTYLKLSDCPAGLILNFNVPSMRNGIRRVVNRKALERLTSAPPLPPSEALASAACGDTCGMSRPARHV